MPCDKCRGNILTEKKKAIEVSKSPSTLASKQQIQSLQTFFFHRAHREKPVISRERNALMSALRSYSLIFFLHHFHSSKHPILHKRKKKSQGKPLSFSFLKHQTSRLGHVSIDYGGRRMELGQQCPHHRNINTPPKQGRSHRDLWSLCFMQGCVMCNQQLPGASQQQARNIPSGAEYSQRPGPLRH